MRFDPASFQPTHFLWEFANGVATITLNRPERKNPLTFESYDELRDTFRDLRHAPGVKVVVIRGAGGNFCSGGDVHEIIGPLTKMDSRRPAGLHPHDGRPGPGHARLPAADRRCGRRRLRGRRRDPRHGERHPFRASPGAKTAFLFSRVGLSGADMGACAILPRIIGHGRAAELLFTGRSMSSDEGFAWGFYNRVVEDVFAEAYALARPDRQGPRPSPTR